MSRLVAVALIAWLAQSQGAVQLRPEPPAKPEPPKPSAPQQPPPRFRTEASFVRVDVYATRGGVPVQDLVQGDFDLYEDNAPQKIESFEHIVVNPAGPQAGLIEPSSPSQANQLVADPKRRVFVIFLDTHSVPYEGSHAITEPLINMMQQVMSDDDLVGVMTPDMSADQLTFGRRTQVIESGLREKWYWGRRDTITLDDQEKLYADCFPPGPSENYPSALAQALIKRRRERVTLDTLHDLVRHMAALREGRTAVIAVTDGWLLYRPDQSLTNLRKDPNTGRLLDPIPGSPTPVGVGPGGTLTKDPRNGTGTAPNDRTVCDSDRMDLALTDDDQYFKLIYGAANRANVSFYTIDPRGLVAFDTSIAEAAPLQVDRAMLNQRQDTLRTLAGATDGLALLNNNDLRKQLTRISDDLTSYYLLGYRSTNGKLDGQYRSIKVRAKRPGIEIRSRHGYNAATVEEVAKARAAADVPVDAAKLALTKALGTIESDPRSQGRTVRGTGEPVLFHRGPSTGNQLQPASGRVFPRSDRLRLELETAAGTPGWSGVLLDRNGNKTVVPVTTSERTDAASGQRWLVADITLAPLAAGEFVIELSVTDASQTKKTLVAIRVTQ